MKQRLCVWMVTIFIGLFVIQGCSAKKLAIAEPGRLGNNMAESDASYELRLAEPAPAPVADGGDMAIRADTSSRMVIYRARLRLIVENIVDALEVIQDIVVG